MKNVIIVALTSFLLSSCISREENYLVKFQKSGFDENSLACGYINSKGDIVIPIGKYAHCYTDTIRNFGMVVEKETGKILGINQNAVELFEVFKFDNGPDYESSGLFRIIKDGKIGYANPMGEIVITPTYSCAYPFEGNFARVAENCEIEISGEHKIWKSEKWYEITRSGERRVN